MKQQVHRRAERKLTNSPIRYLYPKRIKLFRKKRLYSRQGSTMNAEEFRQYCLQLPGVTEDLPFGPDTLVFKVGERMFALCGLDERPLRINLKCDPEMALLLREKFAAVKPGYHMNKKHWNTVRMHDNLPDELIKEWIKDSYDLVVAKLPKKDRERLTSK